MSQAAPNMDELYAILRAWAVAKKTHTYAELSHEYQTRTGYWFEPYGCWDVPLVRLNQQLHAAGAPALSALVILHGENEPGAGFWGSAANVPPRPKVDTVRLAEWSRIVTAVHEYPWPTTLPESPLDRHAFEGDAAHMDELPDFPEDAESECRRYVLGRLAELGVGAVDAEALASPIMRRSVVPYTEGPSMPGVIGFIRMRQGWAIRKMDLNWVKTFIQSSAVTFAAAAAAVATGAPAAIPVAVAGASVLTGAYKLYTDATEKGATLNPMQIRVLVALKRRSGGSSPLEVAADLSDMLGQDITASEVAALLAELQSVPTAEGKPAAFVNTTPAGSWVSLA